GVSLQKISTYLATLASCRAYRIGLNSANGQDHVAKGKILTTEQRQEAGKSLREKCPRGSHGEIILGQGEKRDIVTLIEESNQDRLENLVPIRHGRMLQSAFA